jgi:iron-sulfur cluster assembly protein
MIQIGKAAIAEITRMRSIRQQLDRSVRIGVAAGGCESWHYQIELTETISDTDLQYQIDGVNIAIDPAHWQYLEHLKLDYTEDLMGGSFQFNNLSATKVCGCGNSFSIE